MFHRLPLCLVCVTVLTTTAVIVHLVLTQSAADSWIYVALCLIATLAATVAYLASRPRCRCETQEAPSDPDWPYKVDSDGPAPVAGRIGGQQ